jgi:hypothetical protein
MLTDVVVHISNEQPLLADLVAEPKPSDVALICRNVRLMNGKKPVFVDSSDSTFVIPLAHVRFVEMPQASMAALEADEAARAVGEEPAVAEGDYAQQPLPRLAWLAGEDGEPREGRGGDGSAGGSAAAGSGPDDLDDDLLRRVREA